MNGFKTDAKLFLSAEAIVGELIDSFEKTIDVKLSDLKKSEPKSYEYSNDLNDIIKKLNVIKANLFDFSNKIGETKRNLMALDANFSNNTTSLPEENKWYQDFSDAFLLTKASWTKAVSSLFSGDNPQNIVDAFLNTGATMLVTRNSVFGGVAKIGEYAIDGLTFLGGAASAGTAWVVDQFVGTNYSSSVMDEALDYIRRDLVSETFDNYYQYSTLGKFLNDRSFLKYDSAGAKAIQKGAETVTKLVGATAATVASGGAAAPLVIGTVTGIGSGVERTTQNVDRENGEGYNHLKVSAKAVVSGLAGATEWYGYGRLGSGVLKAGEALANVTANGAKISVKGVVGKIANYISNINGIDMKTFASSFAKNFFELDTALDTVSVVADHGVNWMFGDETTEELLNSGGKELMFAIGLNAFGASLGAAADGISASAMSGSVDDVLSSDVDDFFKPATDLDSNGSTSKLKMTSDFDVDKPMSSEIESGFRRGADLDVDKPVGSEVESRFRRGADLDVDKPVSSEVESGFKRGADLDVDAKSVNRLKLKGDLVPNYSSENVIFKRAEINPSDIDNIIDNNPPVAKSLADNNLKINANTDLKDSITENMKSEASIIDTLSENKSKNGIVNLSDVDNSDDLIKKLYDNRSSNVVRDKKSIADYIEFKKNGGNEFMLKDGSYSLDLKKVYAETFFDNGSGQLISGEDKYVDLKKLISEKRGSYDYRITMKNSPDIETDEAIEYINRLVEEANSRSLNLRAKNYWESDAFILYVDEDQLYDTVKLLEDLKNADKYGLEVSNATKHFGPIQPFAATVGDNPYYSISMAHEELPAIHNSRFINNMQGLSFGTFNSHMNKMLDESYNELLNLYKGDINKITVDELYDTVIKNHKKYMLGDPNIDVDLPLWMNRRNFNEAFNTNFKIRRIKDYHI